MAFRQTNKATTADASGVATLVFYGAEMSHDVLVVHLIQLESNSDNVPEARLFRGDPSAGQLHAIEPDGVAGYFTGGGPTDTIESGRYWTVRFTGATPGAYCAAQLSGEERRR